MKYEVSVFYPDAEVTVKTNDPEIAVLEILRADANGIHANVIDGYTGEVLALVNSPDGERYCTEEFSLMTLGFLFKMEQEAAEEEEAECVDCDPTPKDEEADVPEFEADVPEDLLPAIFKVLSALGGQQAEEILGPQEDPDPVEECPSAEDMVLGLIQALGGLPN